MENDIMNIIMNAGNARTYCLSAIKAATNNDFDKARTLLKDAKTALTKAHKTQTKLIQSEVSGEKQEITLLMVHAQDHLMNALTIKDLAELMVADTIKRQQMIDKLEGKKNYEENIISL